MNELSENYTKAVKLDRRIKVSAQLAQQSLYDMCMGFKEMRDSKLYKELGYSNFGDYCEQETGFAKSNVYNYIAIVEKLPKNFVQTSGQIGASKLMLLTAVSEETRAEIVETTDLENTSVRKLKEKINELQKANERLNTDSELQNQKISKLESEMKVKNVNICRLERQVEDLEKRPIEVAVSEDTHEIENLKDAMKRIDSNWARKYGDLQEKTTKEIIRNNIEHSEEIEKLKAEYEKKLSELPETETTIDTKEIFKAYFANAIDSAKRLVSFIETNPDELYISKTREFYKKISEELGR